MLTTQQQLIIDEERATANKTLHITCNNLYETNVLRNAIKN